MVAGTVAAVALGAVLGFVGGATRPPIGRIRRLAAGPVSSSDVRQRHDPRRSIHARRAVDHLRRRVERSAAEIVHGPDRQPRIRSAVVARRAVVVGLENGRTGDLTRSHVQGWMGEGTLARSSLLGSAPRVMADMSAKRNGRPTAAIWRWCDVATVSSDWNFRSGQSCIRPSGYISDIRFSPSGDRIAFADHPVYADDAGAIAIIDRGPSHRFVGWWLDFRSGLAWSRDGSEIWFGGAKGVAATEGHPCGDADGLRVR